MLISSVMAFLVFFSPDTSKLDLEQMVIRELSSINGKFAVAFKNLETGEELLINEKEVFHAASTMKTPVLIEVYKQAAAGKFSLDDSLEVHQQFKSIVDGSEFILDQESDSDQEMYKEMGKTLPLKNLLYRMIIKSSNLATNLVIEKVGAKNVNQTMREMGAKDIMVLRGVEDIKAFEKKLNNTTTAYDQMLIYTALAKGEVVNKEASDEMINILLDQHFKEIIPAKLPEDVKVAHKTGYITGIEHDAGIVFLPDGRKYVLVLLSKELQNKEKGITAMANVSAIIYRYFIKK
ncbi:MAG: serine hydrolase [Chitinophagaceae bacterium]|nr:serine hydrolase [Chitinophagaceae bacterium]